MEGPSQLVAALSLHGLHLRAMEGVQSQVLYLGVVLGGGGGGGGRDGGRGSSRKDGLKGGGKHSLPSLK